MNKRPRFGLIRVGLLLLLASGLGCGSSDSKRGVAPDGGMSDAGPDDAADGMTTTCAVCTPPSYTCATSDPNLESATMMISAISETGCTGDLQGTQYEIQCDPLEICYQQSCQPIEVDAGALSFIHLASTPVLCGPNP